MNALDRPASRARTVSFLLARPAAAGCSDDPNRRLLAHLLAGRLQGEGCLPADLGLGPAPFRALWSQYFPGPVLKLMGAAPEAIPEGEDLLNLLLAYRAQRSPLELWMATIVATACAGRDHLWQDLGLADRGQLSLLMTTNFPGLAALNTGDMKWKKFIYRQLCAQDGIYVCPAPSCSQCVDHPKCFGPED